MEEQGILGQLLRVRACVLVCESERERGGAFLLSQNMLFDHQMLSVFGFSKISAVMVQSYSIKMQQRGSARLRTT